MNKDETMKLALEALEEIHVGNMTPMAEINWNKAITTLRQAIEQAQQAEPVAYIRVSKTGHVMACAKTENFFSLPHKTLLYTSPPPRQPLTIEEIDALYESTESVNWGRSFARAIEAAHGIKEKNT